MKMKTVYTALLLLIFGVAQAQNLPAKLDTVDFENLTQYIADTNSQADYLMPIQSIGAINKGFVAKLTYYPDNNKVSMEPYYISIDPSGNQVMELRKMELAPSNVPHAIVGESQNEDTLFIMGSLDARSKFQQGLIRVHKAGSGEWSEPTQMKLAGFTPHSQDYGFYVHPSGKWLLASQRTSRAGSMNIFLAKRRDAESFSDFQKLSVNSMSDDISPYLSHDMKRIYFASNRESSMDIYVAEVKDLNAADIAEPVKLPSMVNDSSAYDAYVSETKNGGLVFASDRGQNGMRMYLAPRREMLLAEEKEIVEEVVDTVAVKEEPSGEVAVIVPVTGEKDDTNEEKVVDKPVAPKTLADKYTTQFAFDSYGLSASLQSMLKENYGSPKADEKLVLNGYTCSAGPEQYNMLLSRKRAEAVRDHLMTLGWKKEQLEVYGKGEANPIASNETREGRIQNRRVEILRMK